MSSFITNRLPSRTSLTAAITCCRSSGWISSRPSTRVAGPVQPSRRAKPGLVHSTGSSPVTTTTASSACARSLDSRSSVTASSWFSASSSASRRLLRRPAATNMMPCRTPTTPNAQHRPTAVTGISDGAPVGTDSACRRLFGSQSGMPGVQGRSEHAAGQAGQPTARRRRLDHHLVADDRRSARRRASRSPADHPRTHGHPRCSTTPSSRRRRPSPGAASRGPWPPRPHRRIARVGGLPVDLDRQLPAHRRLPVDGRFAGRQRGQVQRAAGPAGEARTVEEDAGSVDDARVRARLVGEDDPLRRPDRGAAKMSGPRVAASAATVRASSSPSSSAPIEQQPVPQVLGRFRADAHAPAAPDARPVRFEERTSRTATRSRRRRRSSRCSPQDAGQGDACRVAAAHAVHTTTGRRRRRAQEQRGVRGGVRAQPHRGTEHQLQPTVRSAADVAPDVVRVVPLEHGGRHDVPGRHQVAEPRCEPFDLPLRWRRWRRRSTRGARAHRPTGCACPPGRRVSSNRLCCATSTKGRAGMRPAATSASALADLFEGAADVHRAGATAVGVGPRHRPVERVVDLERGRAVTEPAQPPAVALRQLVARDRWPSAPGWCRTGRRDGWAGRPARGPCGRSRWCHPAGGGARPGHRPRPATHRVPMASLRSGRSAPGSARTTLSTALVSGRKACAEHPPNSAAAWSVRERALDERRGRQRREVRNAPAPPGDGAPTGSAA